MPSAQLPFSGQQMLDKFNRVQALARIFIYSAGTTTPIKGYANAALTIEHPWPIVANGAGRFPPIFINDAPEAVRLVVSAADGAVIYEDPEHPVIGPSRWAQSDIPVIDPLRLLPTGIEMDIGVATVPPGWVRANGRTIGSASSGASERASADCEALFRLYWADSSYTVIGGRGASASVDWSANKQLVLPSMRSRTRVGVDTMGNSAAGLIPSLTATNNTGGAVTHTLTVGEMPAHNHSGETGLSGAHGIAVKEPVVTTFQMGSGGGAFAYGSQDRTINIADHRHTVEAQGGGGAHNNMQPYRSVWCLVKL